MMNTETKKMEINEEALKNVNGGEGMSILPVLKPKGISKNKNNSFVLNTSNKLSEKYE